MNVYSKNQGYNDDSVLSWYLGFEIRHILNIENNDENVLF